ncbi:MAG: UbiD family decarboxylase [Pseudomonadota bacterium]
MKFSSLAQTIAFLDREKELVRISQPVNPDLEMAEITRQVFDAQGPAILFENIINSKFPAVSNLMGTWSRTVKLFEPQLSSVTALVDMVSDPGSVFRSFKKGIRAIPAAIHALPLKTVHPKVMENQCGITDLPMIRCWPEDGGAFILLPQVFSSDPDNDSIFKSNLGMYRIQISGNQYAPGQEIGLHYQLHRGIGNHHKQALEQNKPFRVSIFIGGPLAHTLAAVMPLPEGMPEISFAGALAGSNFKYARKNQYMISADADFCIIGTVVPGKTKPEGPFGDHLGYYSLAHEFPYLKVDKVYHRKDAVFPFTVVGRPPREDSHFGKLIHEITRSAVKQAIPGVTAVNAVDAAGVHPLLLVKARERYLPCEKRVPRELLTHASRILGTGQLSLAKYLLICAHEDSPDLDITDEQAFFVHLLERIDFSSDLHFLTHTTMDTLDYSTPDIHNGSKLVMAAAGDKKRDLSTQFPRDFSLPEGFLNAKIAAPGMAVVNGPEFKTHATAKTRINRLKACFQAKAGLDSLPLCVIVDDADFASRSFANFLWVTFTRSNPSHDVYGVKEQMVYKHWGCNPPLIIDARIKPFHAKALEPDKQVVETVKALGIKGGPLYGII